MLTISELDANSVPETRAADNELSLITAVRYVLAQSGLAYSEGAVRDLPELNAEHFDAKSAVSAFRHSGFESSYGQMPIRSMRAEHCPAIGFLMSGEAVVVLGISEGGLFRLRYFTSDTGSRDEELAPDQAERVLQPYLVLARKVHKAASVRGKNDWFWGSLLQGRWLY
ncbi:MAG: type I secretion system permease/ATPase, partial [Desulfuromonadales bacterium]|nr:type I secretion system permease/ATPase [Desulfuromonadales bacterium]